MDGESKPPINLNIKEQLELGQNFIRNSFPQFIDFQTVFKFSDQVKKECGIQLNLFNDDTEKTVYSISKNKSSIHEPDGFYGAHKIFFHTHPSYDFTSPKSVLSMSPSYMHKRFSQFLMGDFGNTSHGGYENIISPLGISFLIGKEEHSKEAKLTARIREKSGVADQTSAPLVIIRSGDHLGEIIEEVSKPNYQVDHLGNADFLAFTVRIPNLGIDNNLLFVRHEVLQSYGITPKEIAFKSGVNSLTEKLGVTLPHSNNLRNAFAGRYASWSKI